MQDNQLVKIFIEDFAFWIQNEFKIKGHTHFKYWFKEGDKLAHKIKDKGVDIRLKLLLHKLGINALVKYDNKNIEYPNGVINVTLI
jgi:hypothetical protein